MRSKISLVIIVAILTIIMVGCDSSDQKNNAIEKATMNATEVETQSETEGIKEYYATDLVNKSLAEILEIMGNDFKIEYQGEHLIHYTSGGLCIFNNQKLPDFAFFINPKKGYTFENLAAQDNLVEAKHDVLDGKYQLAFIGVYGHAKYDDTISADMNYLDISKVTDNYEFLPLVGSAKPRQAIGSKAIVYYDTQGEMNEETAKTVNPPIKGIAVFPSVKEETEEKSTEIENKIESTNIDSHQSDYSSYLGSWNYVFDNNGELDENYAVVTSVTFNEINGTDVNLTIFKGNISKVCQIDITGKIIDNKIDFSYEKDGWENSGHGTISLNGDSIHLYAEVDSYGPNARMGLECDDDLTK